MSDPLDAAAERALLDAGLVAMRVADTNMFVWSTAEATEALARALLAERQTREQLDRICWLAAQEDSWFGHEGDVRAQREAAARHASRPSDDRRETP